jgi:hypothetical protein
MDWISLLLALLLIGTLGAYFVGVMPYPIGWLVFSLLLYLRVSHLRQR